MKLNVGMYVRFNRAGVRIGKLTENINNSDYWGLDIGQIILKSDIIGQPSFNLIDLIEVGDVITYKTDIGSIRVQDVHNSVIMAMIKSNEIEVLSILTHEQFEREVYKIC